MSTLSRQREFIQFCKTLCGLFHGDPEENELFQAIAKVTSLVLQIGEATTRSAGPPDQGAAGPADSEWTISLAQILASVLTEQTLVNFLEKACNRDAVKVELIPEKKGLFLKHVEYQVTTLVRKRWNCRK